MTKSWIGVSYCVASILLSPVSIAGLSGSLAPEAIEKRLQSDGKVLVDGKTKSTSQKKEDVKSPAYIYKTKCSVCHQQGIARAPKFRAPKDWEARLAKKGLEGILKSAIKGIKAMPARGNCYNCTDQELLETIEYMIGD